MNVQNYKIPKYLTKCKIKELINITKNINEYKKIKTKIKTKKILINTINKFILKSLTKQNLYNLFQIKKITFKKSNTKQQLIKKIINYTNNKCNQISIFYTKQVSNYKFSNYSTFGYFCEYQLCKQFNLKYNYKLEYHSNLQKSELLCNHKLLFSNIKHDLINSYNIKCIQFIGSKNLKTDFYVNQIILLKIL